MKKRIYVLVNGAYDSPTGRRARGLFSDNLLHCYYVKIAYREIKHLKTPVKFIFDISAFKPQILYLMKMGYTTGVTGLYFRLFFNAKVILDTGDIVYELMKSLGHNCIIVSLSALFERLVMRLSCLLVVRGTYYKKFLERKRFTNVVLIQDGVDTKIMCPTNVEKRRKELFLDKVLTVGICGSLVLSKRLNVCYGWEIVELIYILKDKPIVGIIIGDGTGLPYLKQKVKEYGIEKKILFLGTFKYEELPKWLNLIDICVSTQTNDIVGQVRTTAKLVDYLACGRYILATDVGEARLVLPKEMRVEYIDTEDKSYPEKLAKKVIGILENPVLLEKGKNGIDIAKKKFEYKILSKKLLFLFETL
ncbi:glycosyltransferase [candidate division WOR-3 bacterium]|nr:glycosyltransferase [candidate division WOR-3 bacterium]